mgnify:CR=1 FL=1
MNTIKTIDAESESLGTHVELCAQRYQELDTRLNKVETKIDEVAKTVVNLKSEITKTLIATAGTIVVAIIGSASVIISHIK